MCFRKDISSAWCLMAKSLFRIWLRGHLSQKFDLIWPQRLLLPCQFGMENPTIMLEFMDLSEINTCSDYCSPCSQGAMQWGLDNYSLKGSEANAQCVTVTWTKILSQVVLFLPQGRSKEASSFGISFSSISPIHVKTPLICSGINSGRWISSDEIRRYCSRCSEWLRKEV